MYTYIPFHEQRKWGIATAESQVFTGFFRSGCAVALGSVECFSTGHHFSTTIIVLFMPVAQKVSVCCWR